MVGKVLIAGGSGVVGSSAILAFAQTGWDVVSLSRRSPELRQSGSVVHHAIDLTNKKAAGTTLASLEDVSHVVFAAVAEAPGLISGWFDTQQMQLNLTMLQNCLEPLIEGKSHLKHVSIMQGTKAYGLHIHPLDIPARERSPRDPHENFYWLQEDYLKERSAQIGFDYTIMRPPMVMGGAYGAVMNVATVLGVYAAICREEGRSFGFPGGPAYVTEALDARLLGEALVWAAHAPQARNQHFNITNGDVFEWRSVWPAIGDALGVDVGPDAPISLAELLPSKAAVWDGIVKKHNLRPISMKILLGESHFVTDFLFGFGLDTAPPPAFISTIKLRQAGFTKVGDTEDMFRYWLSSFIDRRIFPSRNARL
jgi:nucleoside-diphosphate-sugar epimerase